MTAADDQQIDRIIKNRGHLVRPIPGQRSGLRVSPKDILRMARGIRKAKGDTFALSSDEEMIEELESRGYTISLAP